MRKPVVLITGAGGEIGHGLVTRLSAAGLPIITIDVSPLDPALAAHVTREFTGSITDNSLLDRMIAEFEVDRVFHLAALLSTRSEFTPVTAHHVNVEGTLNLLEFAQRQGESHGRPVTFIYPSSIAAYGLPSLEAKSRAGACPGRRVRASDDDVRVQQAVLRAARALLREVLQAAVGRRHSTCGFSLRAVPRSDLRGRPSPSGGRPTTRLK
jgi:NAD(P)-dependent dehydrogenase (short-subunit alcohol dehydrogenase family)